MKTKLSVEIGLVFLFCGSKKELGKLIEGMKIRRLNVK
jgi:hypothetical protein